MKIYAPDYYGSFRCIAGACRHTCCVGWEVDIDEQSLERYRSRADITAHIDETETPHFRLTDGERCPFLNADGLCELILSDGEDILCQICRDHPRFRNFWSDRTEIGLGLVCEEACRLILSRTEPMKLVLIEDDGEDEPLSENEEWLMELRERLWRDIEEKGARARLVEYLIYRHIPDALYDDRVEERIAFVRQSFSEITEAWQHTDGSLDALVECARQWSYDVEYDDDELEKRISAFEEEYAVNEENIEVVTERLCIRMATDDEMQRLIDSQEDDGLRAAYTQMLDGCVSHPEQRPWYAVWFIQLRDGSTAGIGDLCFKGLGSDGAVEIGYGTEPEYRKKGYMSEAVLAMAHWASAQPGVTRVEAETEPDNAASQRVLEKCGFVPDGTVGEEGPRFVWKTDRTSPETE